MNPLDTNKVSAEELLDNEVVSNTENSISTKETVSETNQQSLADFVEQLRELVEKAETENIKTDVDQIKQTFYKKLKQEADDRANADDDDQVENEAENEYEIEFKALLNDYKEIRAKQNAELEAEKSQNLQKREAIIKKIKVFIDSPDTVHEHVAEFKQLQQDWREAGQVPATHVTDIFKTYNLYVENFYDLLKINNELRDYDFKKNLELKTALCEAAEKLENEDDVVSAFHSLQKLHEEWAHIGPVARELRETLWQRFKEASSTINKKHQAHFETIKEKEEENLQLKTALCEELEAIDYSQISTFKDWEKKTEEIIQLQQKWKTIGFASRKMNVKVYERYRKACDVFFANKSEFYKEIKEEQQANLDKKKALVEKAEKLKDSTDWRNTTKKLVEIQKEWKTIGSVPRRHSDAVWKEFIAACDYFFEQKEKVFASQKEEEKENLEKKKEIIEKIENFHLLEDLSKDVSVLKELISQFNEIGHVPFKDKDKIYKRFHTACDKQFDELNVDAHNRHIDAFTVSIESMVGKDKNKLFREREKLRKQFDRLNHEIITCENNMGFFSTSNSKKPNPMIVEMERNIKKLKDDKELLLKKIQLLEAQLG